jgi:hypothetical protein
MKDADVEAYKSISSFISIWDSCFPNVKIRQFKVVSGKCNTCACGRKTFTAKIVKEYLQVLHKLHRSAYMSERLEYGKRRNEAIESKESFLSLISDGMSQGHCELPHLQNLTTFNKR